MQRVRTLAAGSRAVVALVLGAALVLTGCRDDPGTAAYVGTERITEADVDGLIGEATAKVAGKEGLTAPSRPDVVITSVLGRLCADRQARDGFAGRQFSEQEKQQIAPVPDTKYYQLRLTTYSCLFGIPNPAQAQPSDADLQDIYDRALAKGLVNVPLSEIKDQLAANEDLRQAVAVKRMLTELVADAEVSVNPRYRPMEFHVSDLGSGVPLVVAVVGEPGSDAVRDIA